MYFSVRIPPPTCHTRMRARRKTTAGPRDYQSRQSGADPGGGLGGLQPPVLSPALGK